MLKQNGLHKRSDTQGRVSMVTMVPTHNVKHKQESQFGMPVHEFLVKLHIQQLLFKQRSVIFYFVSIINVQFY